jgi:hypothetical protein
MHPILQELHGRAPQTPGGQRCRRPIASGVRRSTLSWCRRTRISASKAARDRNSPIKAHQINLQRSLIGCKYQPIRGQPFWVCGRNSALAPRCATLMRSATPRITSVICRSLPLRRTSSRSPGRLWTARPERSTPLSFRDPARPTCG